MISAGTSSRQPSMPLRAQYSATPIRYSRTAGFSVLSFGQRRVAPPGLVVGRLVALVGVERQLLDDEPVAPGRRRTVLEHVVEVVEAPAGVVEHTVEHHPDPAVVAGSQQLVECGIAAQHRVHREVVVRVIAMVAGRLEDRIQVEGVDAQIGDPIEVLDDAEQIATLVGMPGGRSCPSPPGNRVSATRSERANRSGKI